jgi:hypothetical protein
MIRMEMKSAFARSPSPPFRVNWERVKPGDTDEF